MTVLLSVLFVVGYLMGSVSYAWIICKAKGVDILKVGSGNPGATNVTRALGGSWGKLCFALDFVKGYIPAAIPFWLAWPEGTDPLLLSIAGYAGAIVGHTFSLHLRMLTGSFKGGKAVATTMGGLAGLSPLVLLVGVLVWLLVYYRFGRIVGLASVVFAALLPFIALSLKSPLPEVVFLSLLSVFVIYKHKSNIARLVRGEENAFTPPSKD